MTVEVSVSGSDVIAKIKVGNRKQSTDDLVIDFSESNDPDGSITNNNQYQLSCLIS
jgi:hypothetical protein